MFVCACTSVSIRVHVYTCVHARACVCVYARVCMRACVCACVCVCVRVHVHVRECVCKCAYMCDSVGAYACVRVYCTSNYIDHIDNRLHSTTSEYSGC